MIQTAVCTDKIVFEGVRNFSPALIFDCGQCFRFDVLADGSAEGTVGREHAKISVNGDTVTVDGGQDRELWRRFLCIDEDYDAIKKNIGEHFGKYGDVIFDAMRVGNGIRILRQDEWEALCSFIVSQNNNIGRIKKIIARMCEKFGEPFESGGKIYYSFPKAETLACASEIDIFSCGTGFRAKYISDAAKKVASGEINLESISSLDDENARAELMKICGVGPKVANCALLFGFHRLSSFPIDVWIKRVLDKYYKNGIDLGDLGDYAGVAQQYLFYYERYKNGEEIK